MKCDWDLILWLLALLVQTPMLEQSQVKSQEQEQDRNLELEESLTPYKVKGKKKLNLDSLLKLPLAQLKQLTLGALDKENP